MGLSDDLIGSLAEQDALVARLVPIFSLPTGTTSAGYPFLDRRAWELFRDTIPHILGMGLRTYRATQLIREAAGRVESDEAANIVRACRVAQQVVFTATITAPTDLWLMRHVLGAFAGLGLMSRLLEGEAIYPEACVVDGRALEPVELETDLHFLLARGVVEQYDDSFRLAGHPRVLRLAEGFTPVEVDSGIARTWGRVFANEDVSEDQREVLRALGESVPERVDVDQNHWVPTAEEVELGYRLVGVVLGLRAAEKTAFEAGELIDARRLSESNARLAEGAIRILEAAGWLDGGVVTQVGARGFSRAPGPFGIIETYHPYMANAAQILRGQGNDSTGVWVKRGDNVGASQDANAGTFRRANDALDRFCADTGFEYRVFIEHAIGRGEATRQRFERSGAATIQYFGADLEDAAIDAAIAEQRSGKLPQNMRFVRDADIGRPEILLDALRDAGADPKGAVMLVGNGFHEVRDQTDKKMIDVFRGYADAGIVLLFTEENALSVDDLRATAFNTYHAGFKYVHEKSGQGLRPSEARPKPRLGKKLRAPWSECARKAGYVRLDDYCARTRTIYPYTPPNGHNPSISVNHFFVPAELSRQLKS